MKFWKPPPRGPRIDNGGPFPTPSEFRSWQLPVGTIITAADATVTYPNGSSETWGAIRRRLKKQEAAA